MTTQKDHSESKACPTCKGEGKLWCAACGTWGDHGSGTCPTITHKPKDQPEAEEQQFTHVIYDLKTAMAYIEIQSEQIKKLRQKVINYAPDHLIQEIEALRATIAHQKQVIEAAELVMEYAGHHYACAFRDDQKKECTCGLYQAKKVYRDAIGSKPSPPNPLEPV